MVILRLKLLIYDKPGSVWTKRTDGGLSQGAEFDLVAVDQSDEEKQ